MIENTSRNPNPEWLCGRNPSAIDAQVRDGQDQLINSSQKKISQLPVRGNGCDAGAFYEANGFNIIGTSSNDSLFIDVEMPEGWVVKKTDHHMWSELFCPEGKKKATIFYKAAFYDRDAFINVL